MEIYPIRLGITFGIVWLILIMVLSMFKDFEYSRFVMNIMGKIYPKCDNNIFMCMLFGFIDGFTWGVLIGFIYNTLKINY